MYSILMYIGKNTVSNQTQPFNTKVNAYQDLLLLSFTYRTYQKTDLFNILNISPTINYF